MGSIFKSPGALTVHIAGPYTQPIETKSHGACASVGCKRASSLMPGGRYMRINLIKFNASLYMRKCKNSPKVHVQGSVSANVPTTSGIHILTGDLSVKTREGQGWENPRPFDQPLEISGGLGPSSPGEGVSSLLLSPSLPQKSCPEKPFSSVLMTVSGQEAPNTQYDHY